VYGKDIFGTKVSTPAKDLTLNAVGGNHPFCFALIMRGPLGISKYHLSAIVAVTLCIKKRWFLHKTHETHHLDLSQSTL
jgi:hypothetical protein